MKISEEDIEKIIEGIKPIVWGIAKKQVEPYKDNVNIAKQIELTEKHFDEKVEKQSDLIKEHQIESRLLIEEFFARLENKHELILKDIKHNRELDDLAVKRIEKIEERLENTKGIGTKEGSIMAGISLVVTGVFEAIIEFLKHNV